jgi:hypothetical protein
VKLHIINFAALFLCGFFLLACGSTPSVHGKFSNTQYQRILLPKIPGDVSDYVNKRLIQDLNTINSIEILGPADIQALATEMKLVLPNYTPTVDEMRNFAKKLEAQAFILGRVRSGAMAISESTTIHSSIQLELIDTATGEVMASSFEEDSSLSPLMLSSKSLENVTTKATGDFREVIRSLSLE